MVLLECDCGYTCGTLKALEWHAELEHEGESPAYTTILDDVLAQEAEAKLYAADAQKQACHATAQERAQVDGFVSQLRGQNVATQQAAVMQLTDMLLAASSENVRLAFVEADGIVLLNAFIAAGTSSLAGPVGPSTFDRPAAVHAGLAALGSLCRVPIPAEGLRPADTDDVGGQFDTSPVNADRVKMAIGRSGTIPLLVDLLSAFRPPASSFAVAAAASRVLRSLALDERSLKPMIVSAGGVPALVGLLHTAAAALGRFGPSTPSTAEDAVAALDQEVVEEAAIEVASALRNLAARAEMRPAIVDAGALVPLVRLADLTTSCVGISMAAENALRVLVLNEHEPFDLDSARALAAAGAPEAQPGITA